MKLYDAGSTVLLIILISTLVGVVSVKFFGKDNPIEETAEEVIEAHTGKEVDLTPEVNTKIAIRKDIKY